METLVKSGESPLFLIEFTEDDFEYSAVFNVYIVNSWIDDEPEETELYLKGIVKYDGCSHFWFGEQEGYLHLCGKFYYEAHKKLMDAIWNICSKKITTWYAE